MRCSGILLPISSLPNDFGIGTIGMSAYNFIDFLCDCKQHFWQILPLGRTGYGDSPYQCFSAFAGNPYFIDPLLLCECGLIEPEDVPVTLNDGKIDYGMLYESRVKLIKKAAEKVDMNSREYIDFADKNNFWLDEYALFAAVKEKEKMRPLKDWDDEIRCPSALTLKELSDRFENECRLIKAVQFIFYTQWRNLKRYANSREVEIIGDVPIYVSADSCEMWLHSDMFITDEDSNPSLLSGCPPDRYSPLGQLWGNPIYNWEHHRNDGYKWWISRLENSCELFDVMRIDHFRGFEDYYAVNASASNAVNGRWYKGPSKQFFDVIKEVLPDIRIIAEDLGYITPEVRELLNYSGFPGMKVLQFAFEEKTDNEFLPHNYIRNCVAYTGTHDNPTMKQWAVLADDESLLFAKKYLGVNKAECFVNDSIRALFSSVSDTIIIPMQDWLDKGGESRINVPSIPSGNWTWRVKNDELNDELKSRISEMTKLYFRNNREDEL